MIYREQKGKQYHKARFGIIAKTVYFESNAGLMKTHPREILLYYNPGSSSDRKTIAYAKTVSSHVKAYSHEQAGKTPTHWMTIFSKLNIDDPKELLNKAHPEYQANIKGNDFNSTGWTKVLSNNPHLIKSPIAIRGGRAVLCNNPSDVLKLLQ